MATIPPNTNSGLYSFSNVVVNQPYGNANVTSFLATGSDTGGNVLGNIITNSLVEAATLSAVGNTYSESVLTDNYLYANGVPVSFSSGYGNANVYAFMGAGNSMVISTTGNVTTTANIAGNFFIGNGSLLTGISGGNGTYSNSNVSSFLAAFGSNTISTTGTVTAGNITGSVFAGNAAGLTAIPGANVTGAVATATFATTAGSANTATTATTATTAGSATTAGTVTTAAQANITSVGTLTNLSVAGNVTGGTFYGNGAGLTNINAGNIVGSYGNANVAANLAAFANNPISTSGNITAGYVLGNGSQLTGIVSSYGNANVAAYLPNNTADLGANNVIFTGNLTVGQDLVVNGNTTYTNVSTFTVEDPVIELGRGANNTPLVSNDGKDRGTQLWYYTGAENSAFVGYDNSNAEMTMAANVSIANNIVSYNDYGTTRVGNLVGTTASLTGNVTGNYFLGNGSQLTGLPATYGNANVANFMANYGANTISLNGNITIGNITGQQGNPQGFKWVTSNAQQTMYQGTGNALSLTTYITNTTGNSYTQQLMTRKRIDLFTEDDLTYTSPIWAGMQADITAPANPYVQIYAQSNIGGGGTWQFNGSNATMTAPGNITTSGNITAGYFSGNGSLLTGIVSSYGNANVAANLAAFGTNPISTAGNVTAAYVIGNGSLLTNLTAGNIVGTVATAQTAATVTGNAQANITSLGVLSSVSVSGNVNANGFTANAAGIGIGTASLSQNNTSPSTLTFGGISELQIGGANLNVNSGGNLIAGNIQTGGIMSAAGTVYGGTLYSAGSVAGPNAQIYTSGDMSLAGNVVLAGPLTGGNPAVGVKIINYKDETVDLGNTSGTITPNIALGSVQSVTLIGNITLNAFGGTPQDGQSLLIRFIQDSTGGRTLSSTMKWSGGTKTLSTAPNAVDIASIVRIGGVYYASLTTAYA